MRNYFLFKKFFWKILFFAIIIDLALKRLANYIFMPRKCTTEPLGDSCVYLDGEQEKFNILTNQFGIDKLSFTNSEHHIVGGTLGYFEAIYSRNLNNLGWIDKSILWFTNKILSFFDYVLISNSNPEKLLIILVPFIGLFLLTSIISIGEESILSKIFIFSFSIGIAGVFCNWVQLYFFGYVTNFIYLVDTKEGVFNHVINLFIWSYNDGKYAGNLNFADLYISISRSLWIFVWVIAVVNMLLPNSEDK